MQRRTAHTLKASVLAAALVAAFIMSLRVPVVSASSGERTERRALVQGMVNGQRSVRDRRALSWDRDLAACAQSHARAMAEKRDAFHSGCGKPEIVGSTPWLGTTARSLGPLFAGFWRSEGHRPLVLCSCSRIGTGLVRDGSLVFVAVLMR